MKDVVVGEVAFLATRKILIPVNGWYRTWEKTKLISRIIKTEQGNWTIA